MYDAFEMSRSKRGPIICQVAYVIMMMTMLRTKSRSLMPKIRPIAHRLEYVKKGTYEANKNRVVNQMRL